MYIVSLAGIALTFIHSGVAVPMWGRPDATPIIVAALTAVVALSVALLLALLLFDPAARIMWVCSFAVTGWAISPALSPMRFWPGGVTIITVALLVGFSLYMTRIMERMERLEQSAEDSKTRAEDMRALLGSQRRMVKSSERISRLEERNRLAARIHDEIGHGMSGSVLLLEGAELVMDKEPDRARETVRKVTENLRESVEKIRKVLREERSAGAEVSVARIENELNSFQTDHPKIKATLDIDGDIRGVSGAVLTCVYENMIEALTNTLIHSDATAFRVSMKNSGGLLRVEFSDNGRKIGQIGETRTGEVLPGIGLQNMEERAAMCYGRCFFRHEPEGFYVVMTFPRRDGV